MIDIIKDIASIAGGITTIIALLSLVMKPTRKRLETWIRKATEVDNTSKRLDVMSDSISQQRKYIETLSTKLDQQQAELNNMKTQSNIADQKILCHIQEIDSNIDKLDKRVLENERDRIKAELSEYASRCARKIKIYPEEMTHINEIYYKYHEVLGCNSFGTKMYDIIVKYYEEQKWLKD